MRNTSAQSTTYNPVATYRLQLHSQFTLDDAAKVTGYLARLGVSDCYTSPISRATAGSTHGYDVNDHNEIGPELGGAEAYGRFVAALRAHELGHLLDFVPNHMGISTGSNPWWRDVLENGPCSVSARFFDIDWEPAEEALRNKVLLPILGDQYGLVLERGELKLVFEDGEIALEYAGQQLPVNPRQTPLVYRTGMDALEERLGAGHADVLELHSILSSLKQLPPYTASEPESIEERQREKEVARRRLADLVERSRDIRAHIESAIRTVNGTPGDPSSFDTLHELLEAQPYRLASWRTAADEINYRRFFDINTLAGVRVEDPEVFEAIHALLQTLIGDGFVTGLRIDHPDGLFDPAQYFRDLQRLARGGGSDRFYVLAEKILSCGEALPDDWDVDGTTGYDFLNDVAGLFVDGRNGRRLCRIYQRFTGRDDSWRLVCQRSKRLIMDTAMASELSVLADALARLSKRSRQWRDFTRHSLRDAIVALVACFPVYRTYVSSRGWSARDAEVIDEALTCARRSNPALEGTVFDFLRSVLLPEGPDREAELQFAMKLQQYTAPVQAKGVEDTAFYRYNVLLALNEVGGDPARTGRTADEFHAVTLERAKRWPLAMTATATHDTKLGEDTRARIAAISERPDEWQRAVFTWSRITRSARDTVYDESAPDRNDEYRFYQVLAGIWPPALKNAPVETSVPKDLVERLQAYMEKASREAKLHTSWINPNAEYDRAMREFVEEVLAGRTARRFLPAFVPFARSLARAGAANSLSQLLIKTAAPGVPDFYQGTELWDLTLVDPDNRRPVDFDTRCRLARELEPIVQDARAGSPDAAPRVRELLDAWPDGRIKLFTTLAALRLRRDHNDLFTQGAYVPLRIDVPAGAEALAFARTNGAATAIAIAPTLTHAIAGGSFATGGVWGDARVYLPESIDGRSFINVLTGEELSTHHEDRSRVLPLAEIFGTVPVALLIAR
jgi:(1->4)-alpha-D-glucan 1-alpha-D-glucosylmutase